MREYLSQIPTDQDIQALVDSQLDWEEEKKLWACINRNPDLQARYQELLIQKKLILAWWKSEETQNA